MTDRELLELAAKAAGIEIDKSPYNGGGLGNTGFDLLGNAVLDWHNGTTWNPLTDDGDALRLAVKLGLDVLQIKETKFVKVEDYWAQAAISEPHNNDPYAATRRAIVRAAAEIGRNMK